MQQEIRDILERIGYDEDAFLQLAQAEEKARLSPGWQALAAVPLVDRPQSDGAMLETETAGIAQECGIAPQTLRLLYLSLQLPRLRRDFTARGIEEAYFWDAAREFATKLAECRVRFGVCGTASFLWQIPFFYLQRFTLGRLTYEDRVYTGADYRCGPVTVREGDVVLGLHIPSGMPFDRERRMDSYRKAFAFYGCSREKPLVVHGSSWLLSPDHEKMLPPQSNIVDFIHDFDPLGYVERETFRDAWRVYGSAADLPVEEWPAETALQKGYRNLLLAGGKAKGGMGMLVFDGERLLTGRGRTQGRD